MEIGELIHLRYLGLTETMIGRLPSSIGNLPNLQTLFVASFFDGDIQVPSTIGKMQQLRHLQVKGQSVMGSRAVIDGNPRLDWIKSLQTLADIKAGKWMEGCLGKLTNLRKLGIFVDEEGAYDKVLYQSIVKLDCLQSLSIMTRYIWSRDLELPMPPLSHLLKIRKLHLYGKFEKLTESTEFPKNLTKLSLRESCLKQDPMATLEKLENLRILRLLSESYLGKEMACSAGGFPRLESLHLQKLGQLEEWRLEEGAMPSLLHLQINKCYELLKKLPDGLQHVTTLKKLELWNMPYKFEARKQWRGLA